jgi:DNA repair protein RecN (Recombination protein N)
LLAHLNIKGLAIIDELSIDFTQKFNVITGETGAGKSILIKALNLILGAKITGDVVRKGNTQACVSGTFVVAKAHAVSAILDDLGIGVDEDGGQISIIMRRSINSKGKSLAWINDIPVTLLSLREVAIALIDMFGQHENLKILDPTKHTEYLDQFLTEKGLRDSVRKTHRELIAVISDLRKLIGAIEERRKNQDYISFRSDALEQFDPSIEDFQEVQSVCRDAGSATEIRSQLGEAQRILDQAAAGDSLSSALWTVSNILEKLGGGSEGFSDISKVSADIASQIDDLSFVLGKSLSRLEVDEEDLEEKQTRLADYQSFFRKMGVRDVEGLISERERLLGEIEKLNDSSSRISQFLHDGALLAKKLVQLGSRLHAARLYAAAQVKQRVEEEFLDLAMPGATFDVEFLPVALNVPGIDVPLLAIEDQEKWGEIADVLAETGEFGTERANFMLSANPGEPALPLQKVASGGEVSRIMLALKKALATEANTCILVFDEIDTGISGRVATLVGKKMHDLSKHFQIICISHLPQVAAFADAHFLVHKFGRNERTESTITRLAEKESVAEVARLLSGESVSKTSVANAKSLIKKATDLVN